MVWNKSTYLASPVIEVTLSGLFVSSIVASFEVSSSLIEKADTCILKLADYSRLFTGAVKRGDSLIIRWGYSGEPLVEIFRGVVRSIGVDDPVIIRGIDYNTILNSNRIQMTFEDETASGVIKAVMAGTGLGLDIEDCNSESDRLPFFDRTVRECIDAVSEIVNRETGQQYYDYIRDGVFHWSKKNMSAEARCAFRMGVNIIRQEVCSDGLSFLETLVTTVRHSEIIEVENELQFVTRVEYIWEGGGRTRIWYEHVR